MNAGNRPVTLDFGRYAERTAGFTEGVDVLTGKKYSLGQAAELPGRTMRVLELMR